jgi:hypothetical protein
MAGALLLPQIFSHPSENPYLGQMLVFACFTKYGSHRLSVLRYADIPHCMLAEIAGSPRWCQIVRVFLLLSERN